MKHEYETEQTLKASRTNVPVNDPIISTTHQSNVVDLSQMDTTPTPPSTAITDPKHHLSDNIVNNVSTSVMLPPTPQECIHHHPPKIIQIIPSYM